MGGGCGSEPRPTVQPVRSSLTSSPSIRGSLISLFPVKEPIFCRHLSFEGKKRLCLNNSMWPGITPLQISISACRSCSVGRPNPAFEKLVVRTKNSIDILSIPEPAVVIPIPMIDVVSSKLSSVNLFRESLSVWPDSDPDKIFAVMQDMKIKYFEKSGTPLCTDCLMKVKIFREMSISKGYVKRKVFVSTKPEVNLDLSGFDWVVVPSEPGSSSSFFGLATHIVSTDIPSGVLVRDFIDLKVRTSIIVVDSLESLVDSTLMDVVMS